jgi:hypothetical protein
VGLLAEGTMRVKRVKRSELVACLGGRRERDLGKMLARG